MKKLLCILFFAVILLLPGCGKEDENSAHFYYPTQSLKSGPKNSIIASEKRTVQDKSDLCQTLTLYLAGPADDKLVSPFPANTRVTDAIFEQDKLLITLSDHIGKLEGIDQTIACACLASTCFDLTDAQQITIVSDSFSISLGRNSITLLDESLSGSKTKTINAEESP